MSALTKLRTLHHTKLKPTRDIERPVYPRRIAVDVTGIDREVLKQWMFRGLLDHCRWDGVLIRQSSRQTTLRRYYSTLDLLKLSVMQELVTLGMRVEVAAEAPALIEAVLAGEDRDTLEHGKVPAYPIMFVPRDESLELIYYHSLSGARSPCASAEEALTQISVYAGLLVDWPAIVKRVLGELEEIDGKMGRY
jgi:hypothetical protein